MRKKKISIRLSGPDMEVLDRGAKDLGYNKSEYIAMLIKAQTEPKRSPNGAQTEPKRSPNGAQPRAHGRRREKNIVRNPLVSPKGELDYFSELFKSRPQYDNPYFKTAWNSFVEMRADPKTNPAPVSDRAAARFARAFEDFSVEAAIRALTASTLNEWAGIFPKEERPRFDDEDPGPWDLPKRFTDRR